MPFYRLDTRGSGAGGAGGNERADGVLGGQCVGLSCRKTFWKAGE